MSGIIGKLISIWPVGIDIEMLAVARGRLLKVTNQGHLKRYIDLTVKCDQVFVYYIWVWAMGVEVSVAV